ncbi:MAG TPA: PEGA domain-containing protein [Polyangiales bacterium]|nr:PEGA domain-containing protein [Polyangiales bacterium]
MRICHVCFGASLALAVELFAVDVAAQPNFNAPVSPTVSDARSLQTAADSAFKEGRYKDAAEAYLAADHLEPSAALQLALAKTYEKLSDVSHALAAYREYFGRAPGAPDRAQVRARVNALAQELAKQGVQQLSVSSEPPGANVAIDGQPRGITPLYVDLPPGHHVIAFDLKGYKAEAVEFELRLPEPLNVVTTLAPAPGAAEPVAVAASAAPNPQPPAPASDSSATTPAPAAATGADKPHDDAAWMRTTGYVALGAAAASLGAAIGFEVARANSEDRAQQQEEQIAFKEDLDAANAQQTWARVFAVSAGVLAAAGGVLLVLASGNAEVPPKPDGVSVACSAYECGALYRRRF